MNDNFYSSFEEIFRGSKSLIKSRLKVYLDFVEPLKDAYSNPNLVDLGCGRGEWLELMTDIGFNAEGVDSNSNILGLVENKAIKTHHEDAISFLKKLPADSQVVVSSFHLIEHLAFSDVEVLIFESLRVLKPGGILILETPNPENIIVGSSSFYLDPSHKSPIHPETLSFFTKHIGFELVKILRLNESTEIIKQKQFELRDLLYGISPDYSIVAQKHYEPKKFKLEIDAFNLNYGFNLEDLLVKIENTNREKELLIDNKFTSLQNQFTSLQNQFESFSIFFKPFSATVKKTISFFHDRYKTIFKRK